jgi:hypothetical protein
LGAARCIPPAKTGSLPFVVRYGKSIVWMFTIGVGYRS